MIPDGSRQISLVVNKKLPSYFFFRKNFIPVLNHWKFPYKILDAEKESFSIKDPDSALFLIFQPGAARSLNPSALDCIQRGLQNGAGLLTDSLICKNPYLKNFPLLARSPKLRSAIKIDSLKVAKTNHYILETKIPGETISLNTPVLLHQSSCQLPDAHTLLTAGQNAAFTVLDDRKTGYVFLDPQSLIGKTGFGGNFDILFWKAIIYLAKKPFVQLLPPKFLTFRIEDCIGEGRFNYLDKILKSGFVAHLGLDLNDFDFSLKSKLRHYYHKRRVEFSPHAFTHYKKTPTSETNLIYGDFSGKEHPTKIIRKNFDTLKKFQSRAGFKFSSVLTNHYCQLGKNALPHLRKLGIRYLSFPFRTNVKLDRVLDRKWRCHPYGKLGLVCDTFPDDKNFFVINSLPFPDHLIAKLNKMDVSITSQLDFLFGLRLKAPGKQFTQYREVRARVQKYMRWATENLFFVNLFTHETLINYLQPREFSKILDELKKTALSFKTEPKLYQDIAHYYEVRANTSFKKCYIANRQGICTIQSTQPGNLHLAIYSDSRGGNIKTESREIALSLGSQKIRF